jgi:hypothetical protein
MLKTKTAEEQEKSPVPSQPVDLKFPDRLHTVKEAADFLRCSTFSLNKWRLTGGGPKFIYVGRRVRYRAAELAAFIASSTRLSTSDRGGRTASSAA